MDQSAGIWRSCLEVAALSDIGLRRANNQDSYTVALAGDQADFQRRGHLLMVADPADWEYSLWLRQQNVSPEGDALVTVPRSGGRPPITLVRAKAPGNP